MNEIIVEIDEDNFHEKLDELKEPTRNDIDKDEFLIAKERLREMPPYIEYSFGGGDTWNKYDLAEAFVRGQGAAKMYTELTMNALRTWKDLDEVTPDEEE